MRVLTDAALAGIVGFLAVRGGEVLCSVVCVIHFRGPFVGTGGISMSGERKNMRGTENSGKVLVAAFAHKW